MSWPHLTREINNTDISLWQMFVVLRPALENGILEAVSLALSIPKLIHWLVNPVVSRSLGYGKNSSLSGHLLRLFPNPQSVAGPAAL